MKPLALLAICGALLPFSVADSTSATVRPPTGLTPYGRLVWNLDALVRDTYGGAQTCLQIAQGRIHRCKVPADKSDGYYRVTFKGARGSSFRRVVRPAPVLGGFAIPIRLARRYVRCGPNKWLALVNMPAGWGEPVECVSE